MLNAHTRTNGWTALQPLAVLSHGLHQDPDLLFGRSFDGAAPEGDGIAAWVPPCEVTSGDDGWRVRLALAGVAPHQVQITLYGNTLRVHGERPGHDKAVTFRHSEMNVGPFDRTFILPARVDGDRIEARFEDGMLTLTVPVAASAKPRQIPIAGRELKDIETKKVA